MSKPRSLACALAAFLIASSVTPVAMARTQDGLGITEGKSIHGQDAADFYIHDGESGQSLLMQCSRDTPQGYDGRWLPSAKDIVKLEQVLVRDHPEILAHAGIDEAQFRDEYSREYAGFTRGDQRYIYASYGFFAGAVCDGGPAFFGIEFEVRSGQITHSAFNGQT